ncbi:DUF2497 domain-containing protein [Edaphosphingomonas haloaromaticamans]|uniref:DUF2497 domain-containing protein n=1 Tax=Edaphosphingomonas haloaromaticamans TaxID=653954 RepID=A0A1S1HHS2_9SPHN|nr:DUF2497 domain-containing protein [Sphingomonas haloaromaticamans]OHT20986.1 hypothetical protein BHE75_02991 [Sphingomonas haloaromaticamans]
MADIRNDPSMEEILASIKRIIADDSAAAMNAPRTRGGRGQATQADAEVPIPASMIRAIKGRQAKRPADEVLELTEEVAVVAVPAEAGNAAVDPAADAVPAVAAKDAAAAPATGKSISTGEAAMAAETDMGARTEPELISTATAEASRHAFAALSSSVIKPAGDEQTLEGLVREMLRPMLKEWLDARLPELVEGVVQREIARIAGRAL